MRRLQIIVKHTKMSKIKKDLKEFMKVKNRFASVLVVLVAALMLVLATSCSEDNSNTKSLNELTERTKVVKIEMESGENIVLELYPELAPITVKNFLELVEQGFYDGLIFHRVIKGFMIQGGDPEGTGMGGSGKNIKGEFTENGHNNELSHTKGVLSMARSNDPDSASSQFFICLEDSPHLDGQYASFGKVIEGMETVEKIGLVPTDANDKPLQDVVIKKITVVS